MTNNFHKVAVLRTEWEIPEYYDNLSLSRRSAFGIYWWVWTMLRKKLLKKKVLLSSVKVRDEKLKK